MKMRNSIYPPWILFITVGTNNPCEKYWKSERISKKKKNEEVEFGCVSISSSLLLVSFWKISFWKERKNWRSIRNFVFFHTVAFYFLFSFHMFFVLELFILCFWLCSPNWDRASCISTVIVVAWLSSLFLWWFDCLEWIDKKSCWGDRKEFLWLPTGNIIISVYERRPFQYNSVCDARENKNWTTGQSE